MVSIPAPEAVRRRAAASSTSRCLSIAACRRAEPVSIPKKMLRHPAAAMSSSSSSVTQSLRALQNHVKPVSASIIASQNSTTLALFAVNMSWIRSKLVAP